MEMNVALVFCKVDDLFAGVRAGAFSIFESNPPLGLAAIGTVAKHHGCNVKIFDQLLMNMDNDELLEQLEQFNPNIVGFSCTSLNIINSYECASGIKDRKKCTVFAGGIHITLCAKEVLSKKIFDFLICGEGEEVFDIVLDTIKKNQNIHELQIKGLWNKGTKTDNGVAVLSTVSRSIIDREILDIEKYKNKGALLDETPCLSLFSSRGCPFKCKFCSKPDYFKNYRKVDLDLVFEEIHYLIDKHNAKTISFREDNFTVDLKRLELFCKRMIEEFKGELYWECESRADMPREMLELMYVAGCRGIWCGVETIVPKWSEWINKQLKKEAVIKFYDDCKDIGIKTGALFMFGFPEQTDEEIEEDVEFAMSLPVEFSAFQCLALFPGSPLEEYYVAHPELKYQITEGVALALTKGKNYIDMINKEREINDRIRCSRIY